MASLTDREIMQRAIELAQNCKSEVGKNSPKVAAIVVRDREILAEAYRGERKAGDHAEFTVLEKKLKRVDVTGATIFSTLEPCTRRSISKIPCAKRIIDRGIAKVVIGILDRNPLIRGDGWWDLHDAGIEIAYFDNDLAREITEINSEFLKPFSNRAGCDPADLGIVGPNGFAIDYDKDGNKIEWVEDDGKKWGMMLRRNDNSILETYNELWEKIWYIRKIIRQEKMDRGEIPKEDPNLSYLIQTREKMKEIEDKYGKENLGWDDFDWGMIQGRMSALSWVMGSEWNESLDT